MQFAPVQIENWWLADPTGPHSASPHLICLFTPPPPAGIELYIAGDLLHRSIFIDMLVLYDMYDVIE